jgi:transposase, IS5 family
MRDKPGFFDAEERLSNLGDQLLAFSAAVDFDIFRPELLKALANSNGSEGGRPPLDPVMMFKVLVIQAANTLSDERTEFLINDRLSLMRLLGLSLSTGFRTRARSGCSGKS